MFEQTAFFAGYNDLLGHRGRPRGMALPPGDRRRQRRHGARRDQPSRPRPADKIAVLGFDALPEALAAIRGRELAASIEHFPGEQTRTALRLLVDYLRDGTKPERDLVLLTPAAITEDNFDQAKRLGELK